MSDDLRERIAEALYLEDRNASMGFDEWPKWRHLKADGLDYPTKAPWLDEADAVLAVVQPELDRLMHIAALEREGNEIVEAERDEALAEVARLRAAVEALHHPVEVEPSNTICRACSTARGSGETLRFFPFVEWPCPTIAAIRTPDGGSDD